MEHIKEMPVPIESTGGLHGVNGLSSGTATKEIILSEVDSSAFLQMIQPEGPWLITHYDPVPSGFNCLPSNAAGLQRYIESRNGRQDLYFLIGIADGRLNKQPSKEQMRGSAYLWVDLDPRAGEDLQEERERLLKLLTVNLPKGVPAPTCIMDSGRGYWGFWKLKEPCFDIELVEGHNKQLCNLFKTIDSCWNINRVGRLPGTINTKTGSKAVIVEWHEDRVYSLTDMPAPMLEPKPVLSGSFMEALPQPVEDLAELDKWEVPDRVKLIIAQGRIPGEPKEGDDSRSAWVFDTLCNLLRCNVPDEIIFGIITDPQWAISESIYRRKTGQRVSNPDKFARKQLENAKMEVAKDKAPNFHKPENGPPYKTPHNIRLAIDHLGVRLRYDKFHDRVIIEGLPGFGLHFDDHAAIRLRFMIEERYHFRAGKDLFWDVATDYAMQDSFHPVLDYLDSLEWDGVPRIDGWLSRYSGAEDNEYTRSVGSLMLVAAVRRIRKPGCKYDEMLVMEGEQGTNKSSALAILAVDEDWFSDDLPLNADSKRVIESLAGRWIVEAAELKGMRKGEVEHLKAFLTRQCDRARMAYARMPVEVPRQCVFFGTTNSSQYLRDGTGNRRFWPVKIERFDLEALRRDRDQLWAEASYREAQGESIRLPEELWPAASAEQAKRAVEDPYYETLQAVLGDKAGKIKSGDVFDIIGITPDRRDQNNNSRIGEVMKRLGWKHTKRRFGNPNPENCYVRGTKEECSRIIKISGNGSGAVIEYDVKTPF